MDIDVVLFWDLFCTLSGIGAFLSLAFYLVPITLLTFARPQNLLKKYGDWAVVTGGSSGIGKAIAFKLASQGVNVCIVALDDDLLKTAYSDMKQQFPKVQVRAIPVNLGKSPEAYMKAVARGTEDVRVSIFVNNAGFLVMGFFHETSIERYMGNLECNATSAIRLTHYFYKRMIEQNIRGCIMYTSSAAFFLVSTSL